MIYERPDGRKGLFITLEGGDGAGKTTQINNIEEFFAEKGFVVMRTREPGGTHIGEMLRNILLERGNTEMSPVTEMLIFAAARAQHVYEKVRPALERGEIVICDRFVDSSIAYQGYGRELGEMVAVTNGFATGGLTPDITFWLDIDPETGRARASKAGEPDRLESERSDFFYRLYDGYRQLADRFPERIRRIDASASVDHMKSEIYAYLEELI